LGPGEPGGKHRRGVLGFPTAPDAAARLDLDGRRFKKAPSDETGDSFDKGSFL